MKLHLCIYLETVYLKVKKALVQSVLQSFGVLHDEVPQLFSLLLLLPLPSQAKILLPPSFYCGV